jgi:hypothetical protein
VDLKTTAIVPSNCEEDPLVVYSAVWERWFWVDGTVIAIPLSAGYTEANVPTHLFERRGILTKDVPIIKMDITFFKKTDLLLAFTNCNYTFQEYSMLYSRYTCASAICMYKCI